jgi:hypothetical protein
MPSFILLPLMREPPRTGDNSAYITYLRANPALVNTDHIVKVAPSASGPGCSVILTSDSNDPEHYEPYYTLASMEQVIQALMSTDDCSIGKP